MDGAELLDGWVSQHLDIDFAATSHRGSSVVILAAMGSRRRFDSNVCVVAAGYWRCTTLRCLVSTWNGDCWSSLVV